MKHVAVIYDKDRRYGECLADFFNASEMFPFETRAFSNKEELDIFCLKTKPEVIIADEAEMEDVDDAYVSDLIILSSLNSRTSECKNYIYKYQEAENIIRQIMSYLANSENINAVIARKKEMKIISFYSPVKRTLSTTMAIGMGQLLSKNHKTLYINFECYSGLEQLLAREFEKDLSDFVYFLESNKKNAGLLLSGIVINVDGLDIIPPVKNQIDLITLPYERWEDMFKRIESESEYEYIILDLSDTVQGLYELLDMSDNVVTCVDNDEVAISKVIQYENSLKSLAKESILEKTKKCNPPHQHRRNGEIRYLAVGEFGDYIANVLQGIVNDR